MKSIWTAIALTLTLSVSAPAAPPEEMAKDYFAMLQKQQWTEISALYDSQAVKDFRDMLSFLKDIPGGEAQGVMAAFFGPGVTPDAVEKMSDKEYFASFLKGVMAQVAAVGQLNFKKVEVLGSVPEGDSIRHVLTRSTVAIGEMEMESMEVISFRKTAEGWRILLQGKMKGMAQQLKKAFEGRLKPPADKKP